MRTPNWKEVKLKSSVGFDITLSFQEEDSDARHEFIDGCGWTSEEYATIKNHYWFCVKVAASVGGVEFGTSYLGGNAYTSLKEVIDTELGGYLPQLIDEAVDEAKSNTKYIALAEHFCWI
jgi:hypothetical protein